MPEKEKIKARSISYYAYKSGKIEKKPCEVCGSKKTEMHHPDYAEPAEVIWLCKKHHIEARKILWVYPSIRMIEEIDRDTSYTLKQIKKLNLIPWANNYPILRRLIEMDIVRGNMLKVKKSGEGTGVRYVIDGVNIINYVKKYGPGAMLMARRPKQHDNKNRG